MPTCRCGQFIQSGTLCKDCEREQRLGSFSTANDQPERTERCYECTNCGHTYADDGYDGCPECDSSRRRFVGEVAIEDQGDDDDTTSPVAIADGGRTVEEAMERLLEPIRDTWATSDPKVLAFEDGETNPVLADVDGELRVLSSNLVYPREVDLEDVREATERHGRPSVEHLSDHEARFDREAFEDDKELVTDGGEDVQSFDGEIRDETDELLVTSSTNSTDRRLHIPAESDEDRPLCDVSDRFYKTLNRKPVDAFPPGYMDWCVSCARLHGVDIGNAGELSDNLQAGVTETGGSVHVVETIEDSFFDRALCGQLNDYRPIEPDDDREWCDNCQRMAARKGVDLPSRENERTAELRADGGWNVDGERADQGVTNETEIQPGDVCLDLAQGRQVHVINDTGLTAKEWSEQNNYELTENYGNSRLGARDDDRVFDVVYCSNIKSEPSKDYAFPESRLARVETETADGGRPVADRIRLDVLETMFQRAKSVDEDPTCDPPETFVESLRLLAGQACVPLLDEAEELADASRFGGGESDGE